MINLVVALPAEARPLVEYFRLDNRQADAAFTLHRNEEMTLVVSGPGKAAAAAAATWLQEHTPGSRHSAWLNIGIAGHATHDIGTGVLANRITDQAGNRSWYPPQVHDLDIMTGSVLTVDTPENDYSGDTLYDMEASGFYPAACRFSTGELVQCFKIVSDNRQQPATGISAKLCRQLLGDQLESVDRLVRALQALLREYHSRHTPHPDHERLADRWHFTVTQQHQLSRLLARWVVLAPGKSVWSRDVEKKRTAAEVLHCLHQQLADIS